MKLINYNKIVKFAKKHTDAKVALERWCDIVRAARWLNLDEVKKTFSHADLVGCCTVFNIKGGNYRLITKIDYKPQFVAIVHVLTHEEYDRDRWKNDC